VFQRKNVKTVAKIRAVAAAAAAASASERNGPGLRSITMLRRSTAVSPRKRIGIEDSRGKIVQVVLVRKRRKETQDGKESNIHHLQTFDASFRSFLWAIDEDSDKALIVDKDESFSQFSDVGKRCCDVAALSEELEFIVACFSDGQLGICGFLEKNNCLLVAKESESFNCFIHLSRRAKSLTVSPDGALVIVEYDGNHEDIAACIVGVIRSRRADVEGFGWHFETSIIRNLSQSFMKGNISGTFRFSQIEPRQILNVWPSFEMSTDVVHVGWIKLSRSDILQEVESSLTLSDQVRVHYGSWAPKEDAVCLITSDCGVHLYAKWRTSRNQWNSRILGAPADFVCWDSGSLVFCVISLSTGKITVLDCGLQLICEQSFQLPPHISEPKQILQISWWNFKQMESNFQTNNFLSVLLEESRNNGVEESSPVLVRKPDLPCETRQQLLLVFVGRDNTVLVKCAPLATTWNAILRHHLSKGFLEKGFNFVQALRGAPQELFNACRVLHRELSKQAQRELEQDARDFQLLWIRQNLTKMSGIVLQMKDSATLRKLQPLLRAAERKYISDRLRLGQLELACQFAHELAKQRPKDSFVARLFDQIVVWASSFGQSDTIAPLARAAAQHLRSHVDGSFLNLGDIRPQVDIENKSGSASVSSSGSESQDAESELKPAAWKSGAAGGINPEGLGKLLGSLEPEFAKEACKEVDTFWRDWRKHDVSKSRRDSLGGQDAQTLGLWLECRGKLEEASEIYEFHGLRKEHARVLEVQRVTEGKTVQFSRGIYSFR